MNKKYTLGPDIDLDTEVVVDERGRRITEARAEQIAEETLQEIRQGRPTLTGGTQHSPQVSFRVRPAVKAKAEEEAKRLGTTVSKLARELFEDRFPA